MADLSNPHDRFFRETLAQPAARDFLRYYLPADVTALLDPAEPPELMRDSFISCVCGTRWQPHSVAGCVGDAAALSRGGDQLGEQR